MDQLLKELQLMGLDESLARVFELLNNKETA
jgi:hypothetical protein